MDTLSDDAPTLQELQCGEDCLSPGNWPYAHTHCSGCDGIIVYQNDGAGYPDLPNDANRCSCGHVKHRQCECSDVTIANRGVIAAAKAAFDRAEANLMRAKEQLQAMAAAVGTTVEALCA